MFPCTRVHGILNENAAHAEILLVHADVQREGLRDNVEKTPVQDLYKYKDVRGHFPQDNTEDVYRSKFLNGVAG